MSETAKDKAAAILNGESSLGIELGSTRIKSVLIGSDYQPLASGAFDWENRFEDGIWTYHLDEVWTGLQASFAALAEDVRVRYGVPLRKIRSIGISAMMHGYLTFDRDGRQLAPFHTWRNTSTGDAAARLTRCFDFNIPLRWSVAHFYQAILDHEPHVRDVDYMTTLAGYVHWRLTGEKVLGVGDAAGMFPIDSLTRDYDRQLMDRFDTLEEVSALNCRIERILPKVLLAGEAAGRLSAEGAALLDPSGLLESGIPLCPPEGDAGTGMVATCSVAERTGNVSAGTSIFAMVVLEHGLSRLYPEIDMVTTPDGKPVAMVHCNNCTSDFDAWVKLFRELLDDFDTHPTKAALYDALYFKALEGEADAGGLLSYNYYSGEPISDCAAGRPLLARMPESRFNLGNLARCLLYAAMATLRMGMDILTQQEHVHLEKMLGHGGLFKTKGVGQRLVAAALKTPVAVMASAGEGGAWGIALLAAYAARHYETCLKAAGTEAEEPSAAVAESLDDFLTREVFPADAATLVSPESTDVQGFEAYLKRYREGLVIERTAGAHLN